MAKTKVVPPRSGASRVATKHISWYYNLTNNFNEMKKYSNTFVNIVNIITIIFLILFLTCSCSNDYKRENVYSKKTFRIATLKYLVSSEWTVVEFNKELKYQKYLETL